MTRKYGVEPLRMRRWQPLLNVIASSIYGYRGWCTCGYQGEDRKDWGLAMADAKWHDCQKGVDTARPNIQYQAMPVTGLVTEDTQAAREKGH